MRAAYADRPAERLATIGLQQALGAGGAAAPQGPRQAMALLDGC